MTKGNYNVNGGYKDGQGSPSDTSFRNCVCAMLIFIGLCVLLAIIAIALSSRKSSNGLDDDYSNADAVRGDGFRTTEKTTHKSTFVTKLTTRKPTVEEAPPPPPPPPPRQPPTTITTPTTTVTTPTTRKALETTTKALIATTKHKGPIIAKVPYVVTETTESEEVTDIVPKIKLRFRDDDDDTETVTGTKVLESTEDKKQPLKLLPELEDTSTQMWSTAMEDGGSTEEDSSTNDKIVKVVPELEDTTIEVRSTAMEESSSTEEDSSTDDEVIKVVLKGDGDEEVSSTIVSTTDEETSSETTEEYVSTTEISTTEDDLVVSTEEEPSHKYSTESNTEYSSEYISESSTEYSSAYTVTETEDPQETSTIDAGKSLIRNRIHDPIKVGKRSDESTTEQVEKEDEDEEDNEEEAVHEFTGFPYDDSSASKSSDEGTPVDSNTSNVKFEKVTECKTKSCTSTISRILSLMDHSADPCQDFYQYSCGGSSNAEEANYMEDVWHEYRSILSLVKKKGSQMNFLGKFSTFYDSCVNHEKEFLYRNRLQTVKDIVDNTGSFIQDNLTVERDTFTRLFAKLILLKTFPIMAVDIDVDVNTKKYILQITLPNKDLKSNGIMSDWPTFLEDERNCFLNGYNRTDKVLELQDVYKSYSNCRKEFTGYASAIGNVLVEIGPFAGMEAFNISERINQMLVLFDWDLMSLVNDVEISSIQRVAIRRSNTDYETVKVSDLQKTCDVIDWLLFFEEITGNKVTPDMPVQIAFYNKIQQIMSSFKQTMKSSGSTLYNILLAMYATDIYQYSVMPKHKTDRSEYCLRLSAHLFHDVSTYIYVHTAEAKSINHQEDVLEKIFHILQTDLVNGLKASEWLDEDDRSSLAKKAENLKTIFARRSSSCLDKQNLMDKYDKVPIGQNFTRNLMVLMELKGKSQFSLAEKMFSEREMFCHFSKPYDTEPRSFYAAETIAVPYGLLRNMPLDVPGYVLVARAGIHIAQEIARHFDPVGIRGLNLNDDTKTEYERLEARYSFERTRIVNKQTVKFESKDLTVNREIADNAALRMVTETYDKLLNNIDLPWIKESFSKEKIMFLAVAQEFCQNINMIDYMLHIYEKPVLPAPMRIEVMLANSRTFSNVFECAKGTNMNNEEITRLQFPHLDDEDGDARRK
ncbi:hypothetical protein Trydic_g5685 [Trypoxylus dichotomus]